MVKVDRLPSGNYRARVHIGNGKYKPFTGKDKKEVQLRAAQYEAEIEIANNSGESAMTLNDAIDGYISQKQNVLSPSTVRGYRAVQRNATPELMGMKLRDINAEAVQLAYVGLLKSQQSLLELIEQVRQIPIENTVHFNIIILKTVQFPLGNLFAIKLVQDRTAIAGTQVKRK